LMVRRAGTSLYSTISSRSYLNVRCLYLAHDRRQHERTSDERERRLVQADFAPGCVHAC
jgi:hypothetical protein